jgi:hypothetical protein
MPHAGTHHRCRDAEDTNSMTGSATADQVHNMTPLLQCQRTLRKHLNGFAAALMLDPAVPARLTQASRSTTKEAATGPTNKHAMYRGSIIHTECLALHCLHLC